MWNLLYEVNVFEGISFEFIFSSLSFVLGVIVITVLKVERIVWDFIVFGF